MEMESSSFYLSASLTVCGLWDDCISHAHANERTRTEQRPTKINKSMNVLKKNCLINNGNSFGVFVLVFSMVSFKTAFGIHIGVPTLQFMHFISFDGICICSF